MRRTLASLLICCVAAATINYPVRTNEVKAAEVQETDTDRALEDGFEYEELANGSLKITKYKGNGTEAVIPAAIDGKIVSMIANTTFSGCNELESITIPAGVTNIGEGTGYAEYDVFSGCRGLKEIIVDNENVWYSSQDGVLYDKDKTELILCPAGKEGNVVIADGVTSIKYLWESPEDEPNIEHFAFDNCHMTSITIPASLVSLPDNGLGKSTYQLFSSCRFLEEIIVDDANTAYSSQDGILYDKTKTSLMLCPAGKKGSISIPADIRYIGRAYYPNEVYDMFKCCDSLTEIDVDENNITYSSQNGVLYNKAKTELIFCPAEKTGSIVIPDGVTDIKNYAFNGCRSISSITIPDGVKSIGTGAFNGCSRLTEIVIPKSTIKIGTSNWPNESSVFANCRSLEEIVVDSNNRTYSSQEGVLYSKDMSELILCPEGKKGSVSVSAEVNSIRDGAFVNCSRLTEIAVDENNAVYSSSDGALYGNNYIDWDEDFERGLWLLAWPAGKEGAARIPAEAVGIGTYAFSGCNKVTEFIVDPNNKTFEVQEGILYHDSTLIRCPAGKEGDLIIPDRIRSTYTNAFRGCSRLTSISIPYRMCMTTNLLDDCGQELHIYCAKDSMAEWYAVEHGISYTISRKKLCYIEYSHDYKVALDDMTVGDKAFYLRADVMMYDKYGNGDDKKIDAAVTYESSNESVVSVSQEGLVTVIGAGTADITITAAETEDFEEAQEVITVTVKPRSGESPNPADKKDQTITASDFIKTAGDVPFSLAAGTDGDGTLSYESSDESVVIVSANGMAAVVGTGTAQITITASETETYHSAQKVITITVNQASGSGENPAPPADKLGTAASIGDSTYKVTKVEPAEACFLHLDKDHLTDEELEEGESYFLVIPAEVTMEGFSYKVTSIAEEACRQSQILQKVRIGRNVKVIGERAFADCGNLTSVMIEPGVSIIGAGAFSGCSGLASIEIPESVTEIAEGVFAGCREDLCIICEKGSAAEAYAVKHSLNYQTGQEKRKQTITASDFIKTAGDAPFSLAAGTDGDGTLSYESSDESVVIVSANGMAAVVGAGTAKITITASETEACEAAQKVITVTVRNASTAQNPGGGIQQGGNPGGGSDNAAALIQKTESAKAKIKSAKNTKPKSMSLKLNGLSGCDGYQIQYGVKKNFKGAKSITAKSGSVKIKKLKRKKTYYVRARVYKTIAGTVYYGKWSSRKSVKIKK